MTSLDAALRPRAPSDGRESGRTVFTLPGTHMRSNVIRFLLACILCIGVVTGIVLLLQLLFA